MQFGFTVKPDMPDMPPQRIVALARQAEAAGFGYGWTFDSHVLWLEPYPLAHPDGHEHQEYAFGHLRHQSRRPRSDRDVEPVRHVEPGFRWANATWHRPRGQFPARDGQKAGFLRPSSKMP